MIWLGSLPTTEFISPQAESWLDYPRERWLEEPGFFFDIIHADDRERVWEAHLRAERDDSPFDQEFRLLCADGRTEWVRCVDAVVRDDEEGSGRRIGFMLDVTSAKNAAHWKPSLLIIDAVSSADLIDRFTASTLAPSRA